MENEWNKKKKKSIQKNGERVNRGQNQQIKIKNNN